MRTNLLKLTGLTGAFLLIGFVGYSEISTAEAAETAPPPKKIAKPPQPKHHETRTKTIAIEEPVKLEEPQLENKDEWAVPKRKIFNHHPPTTTNSAASSDEQARVSRSAKVTTATTTAVTEATILEHLARRASVEWDSVSLADAARRIAELGDVNVILHPEVDSKKLINLQATNMRLSEVLKWTLRLSGYAYEIVDGAIFIAPESKLKGKMVMQVYQVSDLTSKKKDFYPPNRDDKDEDEDKEKGKDNSIPIDKLVEKIIALPGVSP